MGAMSTIVPEPRLKNTLIGEYQSDSSFKKLIRHPKELFEVRNSWLFRGSRLWKPNGSTRTQLLHDYNSTPYTGHISETKTLNRLLPLLCSKKMRETERVYVKICRLCQRTRHGAINHIAYYIQ